METHIVSVAVFVLSFLCVSAVEFCKLDTKDCTCIGDNGWGVDMRNISGIRFESAESGNATLISLCKDSQFVPDYVTVDNKCKEGYSICQISSKINATEITYSSAVTLHNQDWPKASKADNESALAFVFGQFKLRLVCVKDAADSGFVARQDGTVMQLYSPAVCLALLRPPPVVEGLGTGAILTIIILVTLFSYCTLGIFYNHFVRGTRGAELIPNLDFWRSLPGLIMDGVRFIQNGCRPTSRADMGNSSSGRETYDSI